MITSELFEKYNEIAHFCTTRHGGVSNGNYHSFNLSPFSGDDPDNFQANKQILSETLKISPDRIVIPFQTHETNVRVIEESFFELTFDEKQALLHGVDALVTRTAQVCIGVTTADCVPLIFFDRINKVVAVAHAGWRGTCARIAEKTIQTMKDNYDCEPADILVYIGPSISGAVYQVGTELVTAFGNEGFDTGQIFTERDDAIFLDLWKANEQSLIAAGIRPENISIAGICTYSNHENYFSARRLSIQSGRILSGIMIK